MLKMILSLMLMLGCVVPAVAVEGLIAAPFDDFVLEVKQPLKDQFTLTTKSTPMTNGHTKRMYDIRSFTITNNGDDAYILSAKTSGCLTPDQIKEQFAKYSTTKGMWASSGLAALFTGGATLIGAAVVSPFSMAVDSGNRDKLAREVSGLESGTSAISAIPAMDSVTFSCVALKFDDASIKVTVKDKDERMGTLAINSPRTKKLNSFAQKRKDSGKTI